MISLPINVLSVYSFGLNFNVLSSGILGYFLNRLWLPIIFYVPAYGTKVTAASLIEISMLIIRGMISFINGPGFHLLKLDSKILLIVILVFLLSTFGRYFFPVYFYYFIFVNLSLYIGFQYVSNFSISSRGLLLLFHLEQCCLSMVSIVRQKSFQYLTHFFTSNIFVFLYFALCFCGAVFIRLQKLLQC